MNVRERVNEEEPTLHVLFFASILTALWSSKAMGLDRLNLSRV